MTLHVGFTGNQEGMTLKQRETFLKTILHLHPAFFHHGCCVGSDKDAHDIVLYDTPFAIILHPPVDESKMAVCDGATEIRKPKPYIARNHDIVDESSILIATPRQKFEILRSGTWATVRYAGKKERHIIIIWPDGTVLE